MEMRDLDQIANKVTDSVELVLSIPELSDDNGPIDGSEFTLRELRGLDRTMQTIRGELANNLSKLSGLDENIAREKRNFEQVKDSIDRSDIVLKIRTTFREQGITIASIMTGMGVINSA